MSVKSCQWCGGTAVDGSICPWSIRCPVCRARAGAHCKRPSGHKAMTMHRERWEDAERRDAAAGIVYEGAQLALP